MLGSSGLASVPSSLTLKQRVLLAGHWTILGYVASQAIRLGSSLLMTRLLVPEMFGVMAVVVTVTTVIWMLSDIGLGQNIIQSRRGGEPAFLDTVWVVQILRGFVLWAIALLVALLLHGAALAGMLPRDSAYAYPGLPTVLAVASFSVVIQGFQSTRMATGFRTFEHKRLTQLDLASQITALAVMVAIGVATRSIWALVAGNMTGALARTVLSHTWLSGHRNRFRMEREALREVIGFGKWIFVSSAVYVLALHGDRLLLGGFVDAEVLGLYAIAVLLIGALDSGLQNLFFTVSLPALSEVARSNPARLREVYYRMRIPADLVLLFLAGALFAAGQAVIELLYDPRYAMAGGMLQVLALSLFMARYGLAQQAYLALGIPRYQAIINIVRMAALYGLVAPLLYFAGLRAALWGIALHGLATLPLFYYFNGRLGLNDVALELKLLGALPVGYLCGAFVARLLG